MIDDIYQSEERKKQILLFPCLLLSLTTELLLAGAAFSLLAEVDTDLALAAEALKCCPPLSTATASFLLLSLLRPLSSLVAAVKRLPTKKKTMTRIWNWLNILAMVVVAFGTLGFWRGKKN